MNRSVSPAALEPQSRTHLPGLLIVLGLVAFCAVFVVADIPLAFVAVQALSSVIRGVIYGYARAKTESVYPPMLLHAAMNLVVVLF